MAAPESNNGRARRLARPADMGQPFVRTRRFMTGRDDAGQEDTGNGNGTGAGEEAATTVGGASPAALPVARPTVAVARQVFHDELVLLGFRMFLPARDGQALGRINREVSDALDLYRAEGWLENPEEFFAAPPPLTDPEISPVTIRGHDLHRVVFISEYHPHPGEPGRDRWLGYTRNTREHALVLRHRQPRPWVICVHGALMGRGSVDLRLFRARHLHEDLGLNVVLPVLPLHGPRRVKRAAFPGEDVLDDLHAAAQAAWDIRRLLSWIRDQEPESPIGLNSMSLGGYISALVASLDDGLTCAVLGVPVADLIEVLGRHAGLGEDDPRRATLDLAEPLGRMVSPLSLTPRVPMAGRFIYAGVADRLVHPRDQVMRLWEHWGRPDIEWYQGAHTGFYRSRPVQDFIDGALVRSGLVRGG
ncbi:alpha/beta hydrolase family protein [Mycolicibacterium palauense]|uniref:alpha/beta hydrolase family protein n=1 Tax=Mycolicibacterium palauense TaxID=2034511 RepID=UPI000BFEACCA|nr:hypothetical protein [Mycolicibacterium palauense]